MPKPDESKNKTLVERLDAAQSDEEWAQTLLDHMQVLAKAESAADATGRGTRGAGDG